MLDIRFIRENPEAVKENIKKKFQEEKLPLVDQVLKLDAENRAAMRRTGQVYFLCRNLEELPTDGRPLSQKGSLEEMYQMRKPLYEAAADFRVDNNQTAAEAAQQIWSELCANIGN